MLLVKKRQFYVKSWVFKVKYCQTFWFKVKICQHFGFSGQICRFLLVYCQKLSKFGLLKVKIGQKVGVFIDKVCHIFRFKVKKCQNIGF